MSDIDIETRSLFDRPKLGAGNRWRQTSRATGRIKITPKIISRRMGPNAGPILGGSHLCQDPNQYPYIFNTECRANEEKSVDYQ
jgi:hypothetical protein